MSLLSASGTCNPGFPVKGKRGGAQVDLQSPHDTKLAHQPRRQIRCPRHRCHDNSSDDKFADSSLSQYTSVSESELTSNAKLLIPDSLLRLELDMSTFYSKHQQKDRQAVQEGGRYLEMLISSH